jgi:IS4 transposase
MRQHLGIETVHRLTEHIKLDQSVGVVKINRLAPVTSRGDVIDRARELDAQGNAIKLRLLRR